MNGTGRRITWETFINSFELLRPDILALQMRNKLLRFKSHNVIANCVLHSKRGILRAAKVNRVDQSRITEWGESSGNVMSKFNQSRLSRHILALAAYPTECS